MNNEDRIDHGRDMVSMASSILLVLFPLFMEVKAKEVGNNVIPNDI